MDSYKRDVTVTFIIALALLSAIATIPAYYMHKNYLMDKQAVACMQAGKRWVAVDKAQADDIENIFWECQ